MGLDTSHDCWSGAYSAFDRWRRAVAKAAGIPLILMEGFHRCPFAGSMEWAMARDGGPTCGSPHGPLLHSWAKETDDALPISWAALRPDVIHILLNHSDCDGEILAADCGPLADRLAELLPLMPQGDGGGHIGDWTAKTQAFIEGLRRAAAAGENVEFH